MDAFITICSGWFNIIRGTKEKSTYILIHPFEIGERYLPIYCPFSSSYIASTVDKLNYTAVFETNIGIYTLHFYGLSKLHNKHSWMKASALSSIPSSCTGGLFHMSKRLFNRMLAEKNTVICKRGILIGYIDTWEIDYIVIELSGAHVVDMSDHKRLYDAKQVLCIWEGSQVYITSLRSPHKPVGPPLSPAIENDQAENDTPSDEFSPHLSPVLSVGPTPVATPDINERKQ